MGRRLRTVYDLLHPDIQEKVETKQTKIPQPHQKIRTFSIGDKLYAKNYSGSHTWIPVTVVKVTGLVSYHVETENGIVIRSNFGCDTLNFQSFIVNYKIFQTIF